MIILASASPRRKQLLEESGLTFIVDPSNVKEEVDYKLKPEEIVMQLAALKALDVAKRHPDDTVIGADTLVILSEQILGKPKDKEEAVSMLRKLSGNIHSVYTGVSIVHQGQEKNFFSVAEVKFRDLADIEIYEYVETGEPMDKAGAYAIQGVGSKLVEGYKGDFFTIVGLPLKQLMDELNKLK